MMISIFGTPLVLNNLHPDTITYHKKIIQNSGIISSADLNSVNEFILECYASGIKDKIVDFSPFAGENTNSSVIKIWHPDNITNKISILGAGVSYNRERGFIGSGNTNQGYLNTGFIPGQHLTTTNAGLSVYIKNNIIDNSSQIATSSWIIAAAYGGTDTYYNNNAIVADGSGKGFYSTNTNNIYRNGVLFGSGTNFTNFGSGDVWILGRSGIAQFTSRDIGCYGIKKNMTGAQELSYYTAIQRLMTKFQRQF